MICERCATDTPAPATRCASCGATLAARDTMLAARGAVFDQDADRSVPRAGVLASLGAALLIGLAAVALAVRPVAAPSRADATRVTNGVLPAASVGTTVPAVSSSGAGASTVPATTQATTTSAVPTTEAAADTSSPVPTSTTPPSTAPPAPTTVAIWEPPPVPDGPPPTSGPGAPQVATETLRSGVRAVDAYPFLLRTQALADAWAAGDGAAARALDLRPATDDDYEERFGAIDRLSLILVDAGAGTGDYELLVIEVQLRGGGERTRLDCAQYVSDGSTGNATRRGGFRLALLEGNVGPEAVRSGDDFDALVRRCTFGAVRASLD